MKPSISLPGTRPCIGVSSCLLGEPVRYDGGHKRDAWIVERLGPHVEWVGFCPEMQMGLGAPRPTLHLTQGAPVRLIQTATGMDLSAAAAKSAGELLPRLGAARCMAFVLKSRSPSCGLKGGLEGNAQGFMATAILERFPLAIATDEASLQDKVLRHAFLESVFSMHRFRETAPGIAPLQEFHVEHELLLMGRSASSVTQLGEIAANSRGDSADRVRAVYEVELAKTLRLQEDSGRWRNALEHGIGYLGGKADPEQLDVLRGMIDGFVSDACSRWDALDLMRELCGRAEATYLAKQALLDPYPRDLR